jgi:hypothetical protein
MAKIPNRTLVAPRDSGAAMPQGAYNSTIRATVGLIQSVGGVADAIVEEGIKAQDLKNETDVRTERRNMREMKAAFDISKVGTDPSTWEQKWKNTLSNYKGSVKSKNYSPVVNRTVSEGFKEFSVNSSIQLTGDALKANRREATASIMLDVQYDLDSDNHQSARENAKILEERGLRTPAEVGEIVRRIDLDEKKVTSDNLVHSDPYGVLKGLKDGTLGDYTPSQERSMAAKATKVISDRDGLALEELNVIVEDSEEAMTREDVQAEVDERVKLKNLTEASGKKFMKNWADDQPLNSEVEYGIAQRMEKMYMDFYKPGSKVTLKEYSLAWSEMRNELLGMGSRGGSMGALNQRLNQIGAEAFSIKGDDTEKARKKAAAAAAKDRGTMGDNAARAIKNSIYDSAIKEIKEDRLPTAEESDKSLYMRRYSMNVYESLRAQKDEWLNGLSPAQLETTGSEEIDAFTQSKVADTKVKVESDMKKAEFPVPMSDEELQRKKWDDYRGTLPQGDDGSLLGSKNKGEPDDSLRPDGTKKDVGFLGVLQNSDGSHSTEYSVGVEIDGKEFDLPTLVPTLTQAEVGMMTNDIIPNNKPVPEPIMQKAVDHAKMRIKAGKSPFFSSDEKSTSSVDSTSVNTFVKGLSNTKRGTGGVHITTYGQANDKTSDINTKGRRGFKNNLLREGSVALSPQIYGKHKPPIGSAVYINGQHVGFYEDRAPSGYGGKSYGQTVDIYDPKNKLGPLLKNAGNAKITFGPPRKQVSNS